MSTSGEEPKIAIAKRGETSGTNMSSEGINAAVYFERRRAKLRRCRTEGDLLAPPGELSSSGVSAASGAPRLLRPNEGKSNDTSELEVGSQKGLPSTKKCSDDPLTAVRRPLREDVCSTPKSPAAISDDRIRRLKRQATEEFLQLPQVYGMDLQIYIRGMADQGQMEEAYRGHPQQWRRFQVQVLNALLPSEYDVRDYSHILETEVLHRPVPLPEHEKFISHFVRRKKLLRDAEFFFMDLIPYRQLAIVTQPSQLGNTLYCTYYQVRSLRVMIRQAMMNCRDVGMKNDGFEYAMAEKLLGACEFCLQHKQDMVVDAVVPAQAEEKKKKEKKPSLKKRLSSFKLLPFRRSI